jgi:arylsulfatase A-like enzyme
MIKDPKWKYFLMVLVICIIGCSIQNSKSTKNIEKPNVIIMLIDDAGYADFGFMGCKDLPTPHIDALARDGVILTDGHVSASVCAPSRAGLITGRYQQRFGYECNEGENYLGLDVSESTIAQVLQKDGYATASFGKWHLGYEKNQQPNAKGFEYSYGFFAGGRGYFYDVEKDDKVGSRRAIMENDKQVDFEGYLTDVLAEKATDYIRKERGKPFLIYWAPNAVHTPMHADTADLAKFRGHPRQRLAAMTFALDRAVGELVSTLKATNQYDNTLIFFMSDNGGAHDNESINLPLKGYKGNQYEAGHRVPFIVSWPKAIKGGQKFDGLSSTLDIFTTILDAAKSNINLEKPLDGVSLLPYLQGQKKGNPHTYLFWRKDAFAAIRYNDYKIVTANELGSRLYNLKSDLGELTDLQLTNKPVFDEMNKKFKSWETNMIEPLWREGAVWDTICLMIHDDLMNNREVRVKDPYSLNKWRSNKN